MKTFARFFVAAAATAGMGGSSVAFAQAVAQTNWNGEYSYERTFTDKTGTRAGEVYNIKLAKGTCRISMTGPASHDDLVCRSSRTGKSITLHYVRHADEKAAVANKSRTYKKDQRLLTLEMGVNKRADAIRTIWHSLRTLDGSKPKSGERFKRAK